MHSGFETVVQPSQVALATGWLSAAGLSVALARVPVID